MYPSLFSAPALPCLTSSSAPNRPSQFPGTTPDENEQMGRWIGERLNQMDAPVRFLLPEGGVSALDKAGGAFYDQAADAAWDRVWAEIYPTTTAEEDDRVNR